MSVVMPAFNAGATLAKAVESVLGQSMASWELIIVDDGSTDSTATIARQLAAADERIRFMSMSAPSGGPAKPRNQAIKAARGRYIAFLDADDAWLPEKLEIQTACMRENRVAISCTAYLACSTDGSKLGQLIPPRRVNYGELLKSNTAGCLTVMIDRILIPDVHFPDCGHEDYALWLDLLRPGRDILGIPEVLAIYRVSKESVSGRKWRNFIYFWNIYRHRESFGRLESVRLCTRYALRALRKYSA